MNPRKVSAEFAAYVWHKETKGTAPREEAIRFAAENWEHFLPCAHEGWGRLLIQIAQGRPGHGGRARQPHTAKGRTRPQREMAVAY
jgi:hypothetical protein